MEPYIGITGVQFKEEVSEIGKRINSRIKPVIAFGVVLNLAKTGCNQRFFDNINELSYEVKNLNLSCVLTIHINGWYSHILNEDFINRINSISGFPWLQLNGFDWRYESFFKIRKSLRINKLILPYNSKRTELTNLFKILAILETGREMILIDQSEGSGIRLNIAKNISLVKLIREIYPDLSIGLAGGLGLGLLKRDMEILKKINPISVDAESGLSSNDHLDLKSVYSYLNQMNTIWD